MEIKKIIELDDFSKYLEKRGLTKQYLKSKTFILLGIQGKTNLKFFEPKTMKKVSFRINKQYRAIGLLQGDILKVYKIDNHQDY